MPQPFKRKLDEKEIPNAELNPLVNPLLAANMGRWAEIYFTTPPERREQAIHDLLRELANNSSARSGSSQVIDIDTGTTEEKPRALEASTVVICGACRHGNRAGQKFCGMCGIALPVSSEGSGARLTGGWPTGQTKIDQSPVNQKKITETKINRTSLNGTELHTHSSSVDGAVGGGSTSPERDDVFLLRKRLSDNDLPSFAVEPESFPYRYRLSVGVVLAILLAVLVYMAWHATKAFSGGARRPELSQTVPADQSATVNRATENLAPVSPAQRPAAASAATPVPAASTTVPASVPPTRFSKKPRSPSSAIARQQQSEPPARRSLEPTEPSGVAAAQGGAEELAIAEKYLHGSTGTARDSEAAAQWLWKAVAKGNLTATLALSDLYLHGDGVPKSCDQGRLLLDAAAKKGLAAAAYRLRNLQAFGCD